MSRILRLKEVMEKTTLSKSTIGRMERSGDFPCRVKIGRRVVGWRSDDLEEWMAALEPPISAPHSTGGDDGASPAT